MTVKLMLLEDDLQLGKALRSALAEHEFQTVWVRRVQEAKFLLQTDTFVALLLDIGLPDGSGLDVLHWLRKNGNTIPILLLTARDTLDDRIQGLDLGADDYLPKPFAIPELVSRIRAVTRRSMGFADNSWQIGDIKFEPKKHRVILAGTALNLPSKEYKLLLELAQNHGKFVTRNQLESVLFGGHGDVESNALEVHVHHLRKKLGADRIRTIRGVGYLLEKTE